MRRPPGGRVPADGGGVRCPREAISLAKRAGPGRGGRRGALPRAADAASEMRGVDVIDRAMVVAGAAAGLGEAGTPDARGGIQKRGRGGGAGRRRARRRGGSKRGKGEAGAQVRPLHPPSPSRLTADKPPGASMTANGPKTPALRSVTIVGWFRLAAVSRSGKPVMPAEAADDQAAGRPDSGGAQERQGWARQRRRGMAGTVGGRHCRNPAMSVEQIATIRFSAWRFADRLPHPPSIADLLRLSRGEFIQGECVGVGDRIGGNFFEKCRGRTAFFLLAQTPHPTSGLARSPGYGSVGGR